MVGPAGYNPDVSAVKPKSADNNFHSTKFKRQVFEPTQSQKVNPGPGVYDFELAHKKEFNSTG